MTGKHKMVLFLCSPEQVKHSSLSCFVLCMFTQHIKGLMPSANGASWRGGRRFVTPGVQVPDHLLVGGVLRLFFCFWLILIPLKLYLCPCVWIIPLSFMWQYQEALSYLLTRVVEFLQWQWKDGAVVSLGKERKNLHTWLNMLKIWDQNSV